MNEERRYLAYLLRLWQENDGDLPRGEAPLWRASLERPQSEERQGFASLEDLITYLEGETGTSPPGAKTSDGG